MAEQVTDAQAVNALKRVIRWTRDITANVPVTDQRVEDYLIALMRLEEAATTAIRFHGAGHLEQLENECGTVAWPLSDDRPPPVDGV